MDFVRRLWARALELKRSMSTGADMDPPSDDEVIAVIAPSLASLLSRTYIERQLELVDGVIAELAPSGTELERAHVVGILMGLARIVCSMRHRSLVETERFLADVGSERATLELTTGPGGHPVEARFTYLSQG